MSEAPEQLALFAPPPFTPNWPTRGTLADLVAVQRGERT